MISISEALNIINQNTKALTPQSVDLENALHSILADDLYSPLDLPSFDESSMDGYAIHLTDQSTFEIKTIIQAGNTSSITLKPGEAARIYTGAPIPIGCNGIIIQEEASIQNNQLTFPNHAYKPHRYIRKKGGQIKTGELIFQAGTLLNPASIGMLASLGFSSIKAYPKPDICILITGDELVENGEKIKFGEKYESNGLMLKSSLASLSRSPIEIIKVKDNLETTINGIASCINKADLLIISGGISVGDFDFVSKALDHLETKKLFYKVNQKPGKPLYFGRKNDTLVFGLPGNPASALASVYNYVIPCAKLLSGYEQQSFQFESAILSESFENTSTRPTFLRGLIKNEKITILDGQDSHILLSFAKANALILIDEPRLYKAGENVFFKRIPHGS